MPLNVRVDAGLCMGAGECIAGAPSLFHWNDSKTQAEVGTCDAEDEDLVRAVLQSCPNFAISVVENEVGSAGA